MTRYLLQRLLWMVPSLLGITLITFLMMDLAPLDRARIDLLERQGAMQDRDARQAALRKLEIHYGFVDPDSGERRTVLERYGLWLGNALQLRLSGPEEDVARFRV